MLENRQDWATSSEASPIEERSTTNRFTTVYQTASGKWEAPDRESEGEDIVCSRMKVRAGAIAYRLREGIVLSETRATLGGHKERGYLQDR